MLKMIYTINISVFVQEPVFTLSFQVLLFSRQTLQTLTFLQKLAGR